MKLKLYIYIFINLCGVFLFSKESKGQSNVYKQNNIDSAAINKRVKNEYIIRDSILNAMKQKRFNDSVSREVAKQKIQTYRDSLVNARNVKRIKDSTDRALAKQKLIDDKRRADSTALAKKTHLEDSIALAKQQAEKIIENQKRMADSIAFEKKRVSDSISLARKNYNDSVNIARENQRKIKDALDKYKNSKHYKDSVANAKKNYNDSIKTARTSQLNSIKTERERISDSIKTARQNYNDSVRTTQQHHSDSVRTVQNAIREKLNVQRDSLTEIRTKRKDSLEAIRTKNEAKDKEVAKEKAKQKMNKALAIKIHENKTKEWTNAKLLKKKWSIHRRTYQNTVTRYNYYYNAKLKYEESTKNLTKKNVDDFSKLINIAPFDVSKDGSSVASNMDSVIKKASFSTQIHDPRSKWFDNLYFLMGKAYFVKNDFDDAIKTFQFIANEYKDKSKKKSKIKAAKDEPISIATIEKNKGILNKIKHKPIRNKALVWLAKSYMMAEQYSEAQSLISTLDKDINFPKKDKTELLIAKAQLAILQENNEDAIAALKDADKLKISLKQKVRNEFVIGQLLASEQKFKASTDHYKNAISRKATPQMEFFAKMKIAENSANSGEDKQYAISQLEKIISDPKYEKYKSQAMNTLASIHAKDNPEKAIEILKKSISNEKNKDNFTKAVAFASLGDLYYSVNEYKLSKFSYDSAAFLGTTPPLDNLAKVNTRKDVLTDVVKYIDVIELQDSLLKLSLLSDKEKRAAAKRELDKIKKQEKETEANATQVVALQPQNASQTNWYFYNNTLIQKGAADFVLKWGNRKLVDNWRRSAAINAYSSDVEENDSTGSKNGNKNKDNNSGINELLAKIPNTPAQKQKANKEIEDAYYNLGLLYYAELEDYKNSANTLDSLLLKYPSSDYKKQSYYSQYLNFTKLNNIPQATFYKNKLNTEFGQSELNSIVNDPDYSKNIAALAKNKLAQYDSTYQLYKQGKYQEVLTNVGNAKSETYPLIAKYKLLEAMSNAGLKNISLCKTNLQNVITTYPNTEEQKRAQSILNYINTIDTTKITDSSSNKVITNQYKSKADDSLEANDAFKELKKFEGKGDYLFNLEEEHYVIIFIKNVDGKTMALRAGISDYNMLKNSASDYTTGMNMFTAQQAIVNIKTFSNAIFAKKYLNDLLKEKLIFSQYKSTDYETAIISFKNYKQLLETFDILGYMKFYKNVYK